MSKIDKYKRKAVFTELKKYDLFADNGDFMEVTEWKNGEGFDVEVQGKLSQRFQLTWGEWDCMKKLTKKMKNFIKLDVKQKKK